MRTTSSVPHCIYYDTTGCFVCETGYYKEDSSTCSLVDSSLNCLKPSYDSDDCLFYCAKNNYYNNEVCDSDRSATQLSKCFIFDYDDDTCEACKNSTGIDCTGPAASGGEIIPHCKAYNGSFTLTNIECVACDPGYILVNNTCI